MKIIGKTSRGFIVDITTHELAQLTGFYSASKRDCPELEIGARIEVSRMFNQLYDLKNRSGELAKIATRLRDFADLLEVQNPFGGDS